MKQYAVVGMLVNKRMKAAPHVQQVLTEFGDIIVGRMGLHEGYGEHKEDGVITLTVHGENEDIERLTSQLSAVDGVVVNAATIARQY